LTDIEPQQRQRRRPGEGRRLLLEAAREVFSEHGYARASTRAIAERAGVAEALLFRNFGSKASLFGEVALHPFKDFIAEWKALHPGKDEFRSERELAVAFISRIYELFAENRGLIITYIATSVFEPEVTRLENSPMFIEAIDAVARWARTEFVEARNLAPVNVLIANRAVIGMVMSMALYEDWLLPSDGKRLTRDEIISEMADLVLYGVVRPRELKTSHAASG
jgi:AcrR family transcriptional regulator